MSPFTKEVLTSLDFLRQAIADVAQVDPDLGNTLTAITDDLVVNLENQMMLVFANVGVRRKADEEAMLRARSDVTLLEQYRQACSGTVETKVDAKTNKILVTNQHDPTPVVNSLPADIPAFAADPSVQRTLLTSVHLTLEALGHIIGAERTTLYLGQKGTGTLRVVAAAPDVTLARRGAFLASHQGLVGSVYSTGIALRADFPTVETRRSFIDPVDAALGVKTDNVIAFPVVDKSAGHPVAVIECANKAIGFSEDDEVLMSQAARLLWYSLCYHEIDFHNGMVFNPSQLHAVRPFRASIIEDLRDYHGAASVGHRQLIVRLRSDRKDTAIEGAARALGLKSPEADAPPLAVKGRNAPPPEAVEVDTMSRVRELRSYLSKVEDAHRHIMSELVTAQQREGELREDSSKKAHKIRLLEDNTQSLHDQLMEAKQALNKNSFAPMTDGNAGDFESSMITLGSFLKRNPTEARLPPIAGASMRLDSRQQLSSSMLQPSMHQLASSKGALAVALGKSHDRSHSPLTSYGDPDAVLTHAAERALKELRRMATDAASPTDGAVGIRFGSSSTPQPTRQRQHTLQPSTTLGHSSRTSVAAAASAAAQYKRAKHLAHSLNRRALLPTSEDVSS